MIYTNALVVSNGVSIGKAVKIETGSLILRKRLANKNFSPLKEKDFIYEAVADYSFFLKNAICTNSIQKEILDVQLIMLEDHVFREKLIEKIDCDGLTADLAVSSVCDEIASSMLKLEDEYFKQRAHDYLDIKKQLLKRICTDNTEILLDFPLKSIVFADNLSPSDTVSINFKNVVGIVTAKGGLYSHTSIIAQSLAIPCMVVSSDLINKIKEDDIVIIDGESNSLFVNPNSYHIDSYRQKIENNKMNNDIISEEVTSKDGKKISVFANIGSEEDMDICLKNGCDGVGLLRTEFLFMNRLEAPDEEDQFKVYCRIAKKLDGKMLTIRTLDVGGDKPIAYINIEDEDNPFLGLRGLRLSFKYMDIFKSQIRAILRAAYLYNISMLIPFVVSTDEILMVKKIIEDVKEKLKSEHKEYSDNLKLGIMIETPASVLCAYELIEFVDFFSIGTNDLTQYLLAVDRGNSEVSNLYDNYHQSVIKSIEMVIDASHKKGKKVSMCGQMASDVKATKLLLEMGLDKFSVSASKIQEVKKIISESYTNKK